MSTPNIVSKWASFGGEQLVIEHDSTTCSVPMKFSLYLPPNATDSTPVLYFLSGLTCTWENVTTKSGFQRVAAELGIVVVAPDTSPRGEDVPDSEDRWDLGKGAGFYLDATASPWSKHYNMESYIIEELPSVLRERFGLRLTRESIMGHSMGGHGALVLGLKQEGRYTSISAFSPIVAPTQVQWGKDAFKTYLGSVEAGAPYDATRLIQDGHRHPCRILIEQGTSDSFLEEQLRPQLFVEACQKADQPVELRMQSGYDHSYYFISTFIEDHLRFHAETLFS